MPNRTQIRVLALAAAIVGAVVIATIAHDLMGVSPWRIRQDALAGAALIGIVCAAQSLFVRPK